MAKLPDRINNDTEYIEILERLRKGAELISDPLATDEERERYMNAYNTLWKLIEDYRLQTRGVSFYHE